MLALLSLTSARGQIAPDPALKPTPQAAYDQAVRPFDLVRRSPFNWSEIEIDALKTATLTAKASCTARSAKEFEGDELLAYSRLCTFGQAWEPVELAAAKYIQTQPVPSAPGAAMRALASAFDYEVQATLRLQKPVAAFRTCQTMLDTVPYDDLVSEAVDSTVPYLQLSDLDKALMILHHRQPILLAMLRTPAQAGTAPALPLRTLYAEATALPAMQQYAGQPGAAAASFAELEQALPATLAPDDSIAIAESRKRYGLLGTVLPKIDTFAWLWDSSGRGVPPAINGSFGSGTALLLFPDWCNQCVAQHPQFLPVWTRWNRANVRFFILLAQAEAPPKAAPKEVPRTAGRAASPREQHPLPERIQIFPTMSYNST